MAKHQLLEAHPAANLFPLFGEAELEALTDDIRQHGLLEPITLHEGKILDGRNRLLACDQAGVEPEFTEWDGASGSPTLWVVSKNRHRRHLNAAQLAMLANDMLPLLEQEAAERRARKSGSKVSKRSEICERPEALTESSTKSAARENGKSAAAAAKAVGVSPRSVERAKALKKASPKLAAEVAAGRKPLAVALEEAKAENPPALLDSEKTPVPDSLAKVWIEATTAVNDVIAALKSAHSTVRASFAVMRRLDEPRMADSLPEELSGAFRAFGVQQVRTGGTVTAPVMEFRATAIVDLIGQATLSRPDVVCRNCKGATMCPGETCLHRRGKRCDCVAVCAHCLGYGFLTFGMKHRTERDERTKGHG